MSPVKRTRAIVVSLAAAGAAVAFSIPASAATAPRAVTVAPAASAGTASALAAAVTATPAASGTRAASATPTASAGAASSPTATGTPVPATTPTPGTTPSPSTMLTPSITPIPSITPTSGTTPTGTAIATPTPAPTVSSTPEPKPTTTHKPARKPKIYWISKHTINVDNRYLINPDGIHETMVLTNVGYGDNFTVQTQTRRSGGVLASPNFLFGCSWGICSPHRALPVRIRHDGDPGASVSTAGHPRGMYNANYDIWLELKPYLGGQPHGAEIMIWPRETPGIGTTAGDPKVRVDGALYWFIHWRARNTKGSWNYIQFRKVHQVYDLRGIHINDFIKVAESRRLVSKNWYLQSITAGFEIWSGGKGLRMFSFWAQG